MPVVVRWPGVQGSRFTRVPRRVWGYLLDVTADHPHDDFRDRLQRALGTAYVIQRELVGGGMSRVFVATETALQRDVVIKVLPPELAAGVNRDRFRREIQLAAALQHPHIVPLLSSGESEDLLYYTMPFIRGESLKSALERRGALPVKEVIRILHDVVDALAYAHEHGVVHRDIKPANVLMSGSHAVITDFGVAKALGASLSAITVTTSGMVIGTPAYMAPEQLAADPAADARVDVYAVGLLAYELLTGTPPFAGRSSPQAMLAAQLTETPKPITDVVPDVPSGLASLVMRCLEKEPRARPGSAEALHAALDELTSPDGSVCLPVPQAEHTQQRRPTRRSVAAVTAVLTVAIVSALALTLTRRTANVPEVVRTVAAPDSTRTGKQESARQQGTPTLTHADSLAIAAAVQARMDSARRSTATRPTNGRGLDLESLRVKLEREITDSLRELGRLRAAQGFRFDSLNALKFDRQQRFPGRPPLPMNPESLVRNAIPWAFVPDSAAMHRAVVAGELTVGGPQSLAGPARAMADSLRAQLAAHGFEVVTAEATSSRRPVTDPLRLARANHAAIAITGVVLGQPGDSVAYMLVIGDLRRGQDVRTLTGGHGPLDDPLRDAGRFAAAVAGMLERGRR